MILEKGRELNLKYDLADNVPNWPDFIKIVIHRCFEYKRRHMKVTNSLLGQWVSEYKSKTSNFGLEPVEVCPGRPLESFLRKFTPLVIIAPPA